MLCNAQDQRTSELSPHAVGGTQEIVICSDSFSYLFFPWITLTASVTAVIEKAQHFTSKSWCGWVGWGKGENGQIYLFIYIKGEIMVEDKVS